MYREGPYLQADHAIRFDAARLLRRTCQALGCKATATVIVERPSQRTGDGVAPARFVSLCDGHDQQFRQGIPVPTRTKPLLTPAVTFHWCEPGRGGDQRVEQRLVQPGGAVRADGAVDLDDLVGAGLVGDGDEEIGVGDHP